MHKKANGLSGAYRYGNRWRCIVWAKGKLRHIQLCDTEQEAHDLWLEYKQKLGKKIDKRKIASQKIDEVIKEMGL